MDALVQDYRTVNFFRRETVSEEEEDTKGFFRTEWDKLEEARDKQNAPRWNKKHAVEFASSLRGQWIIGMALYIAVNCLSDDDDERHFEDIESMVFLQDTLFPLYKRVTDGEDEHEEE